MEVERIETWESALAGFLEKKSKAAFRWGLNDCIMFPAHAAEAMTGTPFIKINEEEGRGYKTKAEAEVMLAEHFDGKVENVFTHFLGEPKEDIAFAKRGDIVVIQHGKEIVGGVIDNTGRRIVCAGRKGLVRLPKRKALKYWSLGD